MRAIGNNMNLEYAPIEYQKFLSYDEAYMYCFVLSIDGETGWRFPTYDEAKWLYEETSDVMWNIAWTSDDVYRKTTKFCWPVKPVKTMGT